MHQDYLLQPHYSIFDIITKGMDVVDAIANTPVKASPSGGRNVFANPERSDTGIDISEQ